MTDLEPVGGLLLHLLSPLLSLVPGTKLQLPPLPVPEDLVLHFAEVLEDHLDTPHVSRAAVCQPALWGRGERGWRIL